MRMGFALLVVAACSSPAPAPTPDASSDAIADAAPDASPDAATDAPVDATPTGAHYHYVLASEHWPASNGEAQSLGMDLDGNGQVDNQLGRATAALVSSGLDVQSMVDRQIATGAILMLADLQTTDFTTATNAGFTLYAGTNPNPAPCADAGDTVCGHHLTGTASFDVAASPRDAPLLGDVAGGTLTTGSGQLSPQLALIGSAPFEVTLLFARAKVTATANGITQGIIAGAISANDIDTQLYPVLQQAFNAAVTRDCAQLTSPPGCGCMASSQGAELITMFDTNPADCTITVDEVKNNSLMQSLFAPDLQNGTALSLGFGFTAVTATFTP